MSQGIPTTNAPSQTLTINLSSQSCLISLRTMGLGGPDSVTSGAKLYFSLSVAGVPVVTNRICRNVQRILEDAGYQGFAGDFMFIDTQGDTDPVYTGLAAGGRYVLLYLLPSELVAL